MNSLCITAALLAAMAQPHMSGQAQARRDRTTIIDLTNGANHALLVGGWNGRQWVRDEKYHVAVHGGERYRFFGLSAKAGDATGGKATLSEASGSAWQIEVKSPPTSTESLVGLTGTWNALPRKPQEIKDLTPYRIVVATVLQQRGLRRAPVHITRAIRIDLDGDGRPEEIINATCRRMAKDAGEAMMNSEKSDYSFVLIRSRSGGRSVTTVLSGAYWYEPGATANLIEIGGALDLNGDGKMEIVVRTSYYEGGGARIYEFRSGKPREVLYAIDGA